MIVAAVLALGMAQLSAQPTSSPTSALTSAKTQQEAIAAAPEDVRQWIVSDDCRHVVCLCNAPASQPASATSQSSSQPAAAPVAPGPAGVGVVRGIPGRIFHDGHMGLTYDQIGAETAGFTERPGWIAMSPDGKRFAYAARKGKQWLAVIDGKEGPAFDLMGREPFFNIDGSHVAYAAQKGVSQVVMLDGKEVGFYEDLVYSRLIFSRDGKRLAFPAQIRRKWAAVVDGEAGEDVDEIDEGPILGGADGAHVAYTARRLGQWYVVSDGKPGPTYDRVACLTYSPDGPTGRPLGGKHLAYCARKDGRWCVVADGKEGAFYDGTDGVVYSPAGDRLAYKAFDGGKRFVVVDGQPSNGRPVGPQGKFDVIVESPVFSPDGASIAAVVRKGDSVMVERDGVVGPEFEHVFWGSLQFSADGKRLLYHARKNKDVNMIVVDGAIGPEFAEVAGLTFSPDGKRFAYRGRTASRDEAAGEWVAVVDGQVVPDLKRVVAGPLFSPDSKHLAFVTVTQGRQAIWLDGQTNAPFGRIVTTNANQRPAICFAPDGPPGRPLGGSLTYLAVKDGTIYRVIQ
jgi:hypothetical protein